MECLILGIAALLISLWRLAWVCLLLPLWRVGKWVAAIVAGAFLTNRLEAEAEAGAYQ